jgi:hypothetical protein
MFHKKFSLSLWMLYGTVEAVQIEILIKLDFLNYCIGKNLTSHSVLSDIL